MQDIQQSTNFENEEANETEDVLTEDMLDGGGMFDPSMMEDMPLDGMDAKEFATMVAETASAFLPAEADSNEFVRRYVSMTTPLLKFGGFEKITAGMTLGGVVDKNPWIGALICSAATVLGLWVCWPKQELTPEQIEQLQRQQETDEMGVESYA